MTSKDLHLQGLLFKHKDGLKKYSIGGYRRPGWKHVAHSVDYSVGIPWGFKDMIYSVSSLRDGCRSCSAEVKAKVFCIAIFDEKNQWFEKRLIVVAPEGPPAQPCHAPCGHPHCIRRHNFFPHCLLRLSFVEDFLRFWNSRRPRNSILS